MSHLFQTNDSVGSIFGGWAGAPEAGTRTSIISAAQTDLRERHATKVAEYERNQRQTARQRVDDGGVAGLLAGSDAMGAPQTRAPVGHRAARPTDPVEADTRGSVARPHSADVFGVAEQQNTHGYETGVSAADFALPRPAAEVQRILACALMREVGSSFTSAEASSLADHAVQMAAQGAPTLSLTAASNALADVRAEQEVRML